ncbi:MAG: proteinral secretion pathway protein M [Halothiobacillaceae bacterium]|nr:MAG: proteinral secretion pathway protein M [Halothiobacillaceae bacterium]
MKEYFAQLAPSEKRTVVMGGVVLVIALLYALVWDPVMSGVAGLRQTVAENRALVVWMQSAAHEIKTAQANRGQRGSVQRGGQSLLALVDQTARQGGLGDALKRVEPKGNDEVRVRLEQASFDEMVTWLTLLQRNYAVTVDTIAIDREATPGRVNVTLALKGAS